MRLNKKNAPYIFLLPSLIIFAIFLIYPLVEAIRYSFYDYSLIKRTDVYIGFDNFIKLFHDKRFIGSLYNTFYFTFAVVPIQVLLALLVGLGLKQSTKFNTFLRATFFLPSIISMTVIAIIWRFLLNPDIGLVSKWFGLLGFNVIDLFSSMTWAMPTIIFISIWKSFGFSMVIIIAGLQGIPSDQYEAALIDGAGKISTFFEITLPQLVSTLGFVFITTMIGSFQVFDQVYILTQGGPLFKTETVVQYIYSSAFKSYELGYASTISVALLLIILTLSIMMLKLMKRMEA